MVTGASRGIGAAVARGLLDAGARVFGLARSVAAERRDAWVGIPVDLTDDTAREVALDRILAETVPDIVINNAGAFEMSPFAEQSLAGLDRMLAMNLRAPFAVARRLLPAMQAREGGHHVLIGSVADHLAFPGNAAYAASKYGARGLHEVLVEEYRGSSVRCTLLSPGPTDTPLWDPIDPDRRDDLPSRRAMLRPEDVAETVRWLVTRPARMQVDWIRVGPA